MSMYEPPGSRPYLEPNITEFSQLVDFVGSVAGLLVIVLNDLVEFEELDGHIREAIPGLRDAIPHRTVVLIGQIVGGEHAEDLRRHGLANNDAEWEFKRALFWSGFNEALEARRFEEHGPEPGGIWRFFKKVRHPLRAANVILRSVASAVPGGGAFNEIKDGVEAVIDRVTEDT